jgi:hypothetical protein
VRRLDLGSVNWFDGMLVSAGHLKTQESYHDQSLQWVLRYGMPLYGIVPTPAGDGPALEVRSRLENDRDLTVEIVRCHAITAGGAIVYIDGESEIGRAGPVIGQRALSSGLEQMIPVYVRAVGERKPAGAPDASGNPPQRVGAYDVLLSDEEAGGSRDCLKVAELVAANYQIRESDSYLPPSCAMTATEPLRRLGEEISRLAQTTLDELVEALRAAPPSADMHPWHLSARGVLDGVLAGWSLGIEALVGWEPVAPVQFAGGIRALLRVFANALTAHAPVRETLDGEFLQAGGLPGEAGGLDFHAAVGRYVSTPYGHDGMSRQLREGRQLLHNARECLQFIVGKLETGVEGGVAAPRPKVTYRQQDHYLLDVGKIESSLTEESQVLYFRSLGEKEMRSVLFVLRNNAAEGVDARDIRLKGGVNDDRPLYCPELQPDFKERPGRIYLLMEVERGKRDRVDYITLRSSGVVDLEELLRNQATDIRLYYL